MKKNQYQSIFGLQESLRELFATVNYVPQEIHICIPNGIVQFFSYTNKGMAADYIDLLTQQVKEATEKSENIRLDHWSEKEGMEELQKEVKSYEAIIGAQSAKIERLEKQLEENGSHCKEAEISLKALIQNIITLRDSQLIKRDYLYDQGEQEGSVPLRIVEATLKETANALKKCGVEILEDEGKFSSGRQTIVDVRETEEEALDGQIAEVVRPGYCYQGEQLRGQEVVVYKKKQGSCEKRE